MPRTEDDTRDDLDSSDDEDLDQDTERTEDDSSSDSTDDTGEDSADLKGEAKRIADLQSKADKAEARANKAEKALAASRGEDKADPATQALMLELREASLDAVYGEYPELREYSINRDLIEGTTRADMRVSAKALVSLVKSVSTKARNKALAENGLTAEPQGSKRRPPVDYGSMSEADFKKELARLTGR